MNDNLIEFYLLSKQIGALGYKKMYFLLEKIGLYPGQNILLDIIKKNEGISQSDLAKLAYKEPATITTMLNKMTNQGYITRKVDKKDRRIIRIYLTDYGKDICLLINDLIKKYEQDLLSNLSSSEIDTFFNILLKIKDNLEN